MDAEERRAQAVGSLREVERRQAAGELEPEEADELIELFAERAAVATAELEAGRVPRHERSLPVLVVAAVLVLTVLVVVLMQRHDGDPGAPDEPPAAMALALAERFLEEGDLRQANQHAALALRSDPSAGERHRAEVYLGWTTAQLGDLDEGERLLRAAVERDPVDLNARWYLANVLADSGQRDEAVRMLRSLLEEDIAAAQREVIEEKLANP